MNNNLEKQKEITPQLKEFIKKMNSKQIWSFAALFVLSAFIFTLVNFISSVLNSFLPQVTEVSNVISIIMYLLFTMIFIIIALLLEILFIYYFARLYDFLRKSFSKKIVNTYVLVCCLSTVSMSGNNTIVSLVDKIL